tara:strand:+ start:3244 stop:3720 length:477 start_codon:yes stop_codon:yes gene_type:complete
VLEMVVKDGARWRRVNSRKIKGQWYSLDGDEELDNMPEIFITIDGKVPKNMTGEGEDTFELWPVKRNGDYRYSGMTYYDYTNSHGYYYAVKEYTFWDGILHSHTTYYHTDRQVEFLEKKMQLMGENLKAHLNGEEEPHKHWGMPFFVSKDERFVQARY